MCIFFQVTFNNNEYVCYCCWTRSRRGNLRRLSVSENPQPELPLPDVSLKKPGIKLMALRQTTARDRREP